MSVIKRYEYPPFCYYSSPKERNSYNLREIIFDESLYVTLHRQIIKVKLRINNKDIIEKKNKIEIN